YSFHPSLPKGQLAGSIRIVLFARSAIVSLADDQVSVKCLAGYAGFNDSSARGGWRCRSRSTRSSASDARAACGGAASGRVREVRVLWLTRYKISIWCLSHSHKHRMPDDKTGYACGSACMRGRLLAGHGGDPA